MQLSFLQKIIEKDEILFLLIWGQVQEDAISELLKM